jgi:long-chain acyl-CoA synthetase
MKLGMRGIYQPRFDARQWLQVVQAEKPTAVFLVPSMVQLLLTCEEFEEADLSSIQICAIGSAPLAPFALERIQEKLPDAMVSSNYGMTEAGSVYAITPKGEAVRRPGTVGQIVPPAQVRIVGPQGEEMPVGETGEVQVLVPGKSREYYKDPEATRSTWRDGWLCTGDLGRLDADGYLYIVGRAKDVIIRGGNNIHAVDVENVILAHPDVAEAAVVGAPHPVLGEDPVGFVVLRPGASLTGDELRAFCLDRLADYKVPRRWVFRDGLPRNATGKVVKGDLRALLECLDD